MRSARTLFLRRLVIVVLAAALSPCSTLWAAATAPDIVIPLKGGVGSIRAQRTWTQGDRLCYESRGFQNCIPKDRVASVPQPKTDQAAEAAQTPQPAQASTAAGAAEAPPADRPRFDMEGCLASGKSAKQCDEAARLFRLYYLLRRTAERPID